MERGFEVLGWYVEKGVEEDLRARHLLSIPNIPAAEIGVSPAVDCVFPLCVSEVFWMPSESSSVESTR